MSSEAQEPVPTAARAHEGAAEDATRRTRLANERTYLAWWRTGLTSLAVSLGAGKLIPALAPGVRWPYTVAGIGFALVGLTFIGYAPVRHRRVEQALARGEFPPPEERLIAALAVVGVALAVLVFAIVLTQN
jgi:putative membrane protein